MARNRPDKPRRNNSLRIGAVIVVALLASGIGWWLSQKPVVLNEREYDITIALYRVCNQRSIEGLTQIENHLNEALSTQHATNPSHIALMAMVEQAKAGQWREAAIACRQALDDQVKR